MQEDFFVAKTNSTCKKYKFQDSIIEKLMT